MAEPPVNIIRENTRSILNINRRFQRNERSNGFRSIDEQSITPEAITEIANKLKTKSSISVKELQLLKNGLINDPKSIELVLNTHGALRGIIRELTGQDVKKQCEAAGCCCNLALGDSKACMAVAKAAGPYLIAELSSLTSELALTCAWAVGNAAGSAGGAARVLAAQAAPAALARLARRAGALECAALRALSLLARRLPGGLGGDNLINTLNTLSELSVTMESSQLLFVLSCHTEFPQYVPEALVQKVLEEFPGSIESHFNCCEKKICCKLIYLVRILANLNMDQYYNVVINYFLLNNISVAIKSVLSLNNVTLNNSILWLLGNLYNHCDKEFFVHIIS